MEIEIKSKIPVRGSYNVIVAGGGVAGVAAAVAAAREGKKVLLLEKSTMLGGLATLGLINYFVPMCNGRGVQIIKGMAEEFLRLSISHGYDTLPAEWREGEPKLPTNVRYVTRYSATIFALELTALLNKEGVKILFDTVVSEPVMEGKKCLGLVCESKSGREFYGADMVVDATGDADVLFRAGVPTVQGRNFHTYLAAGVSLESCKRAVESGDIAKIYTGYAGGRATLYGDYHPSGMAFYKGTDVDDLNTYFLRNQLECLKNISGMPRSSREIVMLPGMAQMRTTRHINGNYTLRSDDVYKHFDDSIGAINDFDRRDFLFEIPYGSLVRNDYPNLITAGRTAAGEGYAWDVLRVIPPAIISGQAAGLAASEAINEGKGLCDINIKALQKKLEAGNVMIHFDDSLINRDADPGRALDNDHI